MKKPFEVGQKVTKWEDYKGTMGKMVLTVERIERGNSQSGWCVWTASEVCPCCGNSVKKYKDLDSDWFVKVE